MSKGFTLIELMIVVAIIGVLAAVAIPSYQRYVATSRVAVALQEISGGRTAYEFLVNKDYASMSSVTDINLPPTTEQCQISTNLPDNTGFANKAIRCVIINPGIIGVNAEIYLTRQIDGSYKCHTENINTNFIPKECN